MKSFYVKGITLFELVITMTIIAIIASLAIPSFHNMMARQESQKTIHLLRHIIQYSKTQALINRSRVIICSSKDGMQCHNHEWAKGILVINDKNENNQVDANETIYTYQTLHLKYGTLVWRGALNRNNVFFNAQQGLPNGSNGSFYYCNPTTQQHHRIVLSKMGHSRVETTQDC